MSEKQIEDPQEQTISSAASLRSQTPVPTVTKPVGESATVIPQESASVIAKSSVIKKASVSGFTSESATSTVMAAVIVTEDISSKIKLQCPIHRQDILKVCVKKECKEKMFFCVECIEEFAEHTVRHRPFMPFGQFLNEVANNPHTQRKQRIEKLQQDNAASVQTFLKNAAGEKARIAQTVIPALKKAVTDLCDQLQERLFDEIDQSIGVFQYNSSYLTSYLETKGLLAQILDQVPSLNEIVSKFEQCQGGDEAEFMDYLETIKRRTLKESCVEQTRQAFAYFEDIFQTFQEQGRITPRFVGEQDLMASITDVFSKFVESDAGKFSNVVSRYPICSSCSRSVDSQYCLTVIENKIKDLENELRKRTSSSSASAASSSTKLPTKITAAAASSSASTHSIAREIERLQKIQPAVCKGCQRLQCVVCQTSTNPSCKGCKIELDPQLKTSKFLIKESKTGCIAMLDDTTKQLPITITRTAAFINPKFTGLQVLLKKSIIGIAINNQEHYSGRLEWEVTVENFSSCHSAGFGICKLEELKEELEINKDLKDFTSSKSLILLTTNGTVSGNLKGRVQTFQKEKNPAVFTCVLDFGKNKFSIVGRNVFLERELENNQGYVPCFYSGCCFKSYNNFAIRQIYQFEPTKSQIKKWE